MGEARALNDIGSVYQAHGDTRKAIEFHQKALAVREEIGQRPAQSTSLLNLGRVYLQQGDAPRALEVLRRALAIAEEVKSKPHIYQVHLELSKAYDLTGDTARSFLHYKDFHRVKEEVISNRANAKIKNLQTRHEVERAEKETEIARPKKCRAQREEPAVGAVTRGAASDPGSTRPVGKNGSSGQTDGRDRARNQYTCGRPQESLRHRWSLRYQA